MLERAGRIKDLIEQSNFTYQELEKKTGIKKSSLQRYATGTTAKIPLTAIEKLAEAFDVSPAFLMWGNEEKNPATENDSEISKVKKELIEKVMQMSDADLEKLNLLLQIVEAK